MKISQQLLVIMYLARSASSFHTHRAVPLGSRAVLRAVQDGCGSISNNPSVAAYALQRLRDLGLDKVFGVPGDYSFSIDDAAELCAGLDWVGCSNELNAAYAADGYARARGAAILTTTYGVGELSAINGVMGSKAHRLPVFHLVGCPSERIQHLGLATHHSLGDTSHYHRFHAISATACCVSAVLTPDNAIDELERVIREALRLSAPAYISISELSGKLPVIGKPVVGRPLADLKRQHSNAKELDAAVSAVLHRLHSADAPVALVTELVARYGLSKQATGLISKANLRFAEAPSDKGTLDAGLVQYLGLYNGDNSSPPEVQELVQNADVILDIGGFIETELNTGFWSEKINATRLLSLHDNWVRIGDAVFVNVALEDVISELTVRVHELRGHELGTKKELLPLIGKGDAKMTSKAFYPRLQRAIKKGDTLISDTGTCMLHLNRMLLPGGVGFEEQGIWGSIGWATPACMGVELANQKDGTKGRTWMVTGDGAHQMTLNELGVMGRYGVKPIIFVLNNGIYGVEDLLSARGHEYDDIAQVSYHLLPEAFGCHGWLSAKVATVQELEKVLGDVAVHRGAAYIEVVIPEEESQPLPSDIIDRAYKLKTPMV